MIIHRVDGYISANTTLNPCKIHHFGVPGVAEMDASEKGSADEDDFGVFLGTICHSKSKNKSQRSRDGAQCQEQCLWRRKYE